MEEVTWKTIEAIYLSQDDEGLLIKCDGEYHEYTMLGDCCSHSYVSNIETNYWIQFSALWGKRIDKVERMEDMGEVEASTQDVDRVYWYEFSIWDDKLFITHRNSSNGWYGWETCYDWIVEEPDLSQRKKIEEKFISSFVW